MEDFLNFVRQNLPGMVLIGVGLFCCLGNICVVISNQRKKTHVSGIPLLGAILILIGGLLTSCKWLALLAILDLSVMQLFQAIHFGNNFGKIMEKRYASFLREKGFSERREDPGKQITSEIHYTDRDVPHIQTYPYITNKAFIIGYPWAVILLCEKEGKRFLVLDTGTDEKLKHLNPEKIRVLDFPEDTIQLHDVADYLLGDIEIRIEKKSQEE